MKPRTVEEWVTIFRTRATDDPVAIADRILGDILGYASPARSVRVYGWRARDNAELANALEGYRQFINEDIANRRVDTERLPYPLNED